MPSVSVDKRACTPSGGKKTPSGSCVVAFMAAASTEADDSTVSARALNPTGSPAKRDIANPWRPSSMYSSTLAGYRNGIIEAANR